MSGKVNLDKIKEDPECFKEFISEFCISLDILAEDGEEYLGRYKGRRVSLTFEDYIDSEAIFDKHVLWTEKNKT